MNLIGRQIGNIRVDTLLGVGGMGEVYRGFDIRLERHVAIKSLRAKHRFDDEARARFSREARILSRLESASICQVYDLIEGDEADYLIFEFVEGETLRDLLIRRPLSETEALTLAAKIARALTVAHNERIVHRDLKPENVMVTPDDEIKILDFGISSAVRDPSGALTEVTPAAPPPGSSPEESPDAGDTSVLTRDVTVLEGATHRMPDPLYGSESTARDSAAKTVPVASLDARLTRHGMRIGTLAFMSPEQASGQAVDESSDLYSFGLLLQEMLTHRPARQRSDSNPAQVLSRAVQGETVAIEDPDLDRDAVRLVEDLLRHDRERRPTAAETAERLRWILDRPKRALRQKRRNRLISAAFAGLTLVLIVVSVLAARADRAARRAEWEAQRAESEAQRANDQAAWANLEARRAREVADFLVELFEAADPEEAQGRDVRVREILERGSARIERELETQPLVQARLLDTLGTIHWRLGDYPEAERLLTSALDLRRQHLPKDSPDRAESKQHLAALFADQGRLELAEPLLRDAIEALEGAEGEEAPVLPSLINDLATLRFERGDLAGAETLYQRSLEITDRLFGNQSVEFARRLNNLAVLAWQLADYPRAKTLYEQSLAIQEKELGANHPDLAAMLNNLGILHRETGDFETGERLHGRALAIAEASLGPTHPDVAAILDSLGRLLAQQGRLDDALPRFERAYAIRSEVLGADNYEVGRTLTNLGDLLRRRGEHERAEAMLRRARRLLADTVGEDHPWTLDASHALANTHRDSGQLDAARDLYRRTLTAAGSVFGDEHPEVAAIRRDLAQLEETEPR